MKNAISYIEIHKHYQKKANRINLIDLKNIGELH